MENDLLQIQQRLIETLKVHLPILKVTIDTPERFEVTGTIPTMQGRKKVDGIYFASVVPKPKDIRFYFFPIYTHKDEMGDLPENLQKSLKGKSCFHIKKWDPEFEQHFNQMVNKGITIYQKAGLLK